MTDANPNDTPVLMAIARSIWECIPAGVEDGVPDDMGCCVMLTAGDIRALTIVLAEAACGRTGCKRRM